MYCLRTVLSPPENKFLAPYAIKAYGQIYIGYSSHSFLTFAVDGGDYAAPL